jgi:hypothetical protein
MFQKRCEFIELPGSVQAFVLKSSNSLKRSSRSSCSNRVESELSKARRFVWETGEEVAR